MFNLTSRLDESQAADVSNHPFMEMSPPRMQMTFDNWCVSMTRNARMN